MPDEPAPPPRVIHMRFADDQQHIRKWSFAPFEDSAPYVRQEEVTRDLARRLYAGVLRDGGIFSGNVIAGECDANPGMLAIRQALGENVDG